MSHEITQRADGTAEAAFALTPAWHGLGTVTDGAMNGADALRIAQLDWEVEKRPLFRKGALNNLPGMELSAWGAVNAVTEYVDHHAEIGRESESYSEGESAFRVKMLGAGAALKAKAWQEAVALLD